MWRGILAAGGWDLHRCHLERCRLRKGRLCLHLVRGWTGRHGYTGKVILRCHLGISWSLRGRVSIRLNRRLLVTLLLLQRCSLVVLWSLLLLANVLVRSGISRPFNTFALVERGCRLALHWIWHVLCALVRSPCCNIGTTGNCDSSGNVH